MLDEAETARKKCSEELLAQEQEKYIYIYIYVYIYIYTYIQMCPQLRPVVCVGAR